MKLPLWLPSPEVVPLLMNRPVPLPLSKKRAVKVLPASTNMKPLCNESVVDVNVARPVRVKPQLVVPGLMVRSSIVRVPPERTGANPEPTMPTSSPEVGTPVGDQFDV